MPSLELTVSLEPWSQCLAEIAGLFPLHWEEVEGAGRLEMDFGAYSRAERSGGFLCFVLRRDSIAVGYWTILLSPFLHSRSLRAATTDMVFIEQSARTGGAFDVFVREVEFALRGRGVALWFVGEKVRKPLGALLRKYGFDAEEVVYLKRLGA